MKRIIIATAQKIATNIFKPVLEPINAELQTANISFYLHGENKNALLAHRDRYFSQNDEDGILLEVLNRIELKGPGVFLEFGVGDGTECNTIILLAHRWRGVWVGAENLAFELPAKTRLVFLQRWITRDNAVSLASEGVAALAQSLIDVRVASVDLDGNDPHIVRALIADVLKPDVFIVEYNSKFPPSVEFEMSYDAEYVWRGGDYFGASLLTWTKIFSAAGYTLVACNGNGINAFFVKNKHMPKFADIPTDINQVYRRKFLYTYPAAGHPTSPQTVRHLASEL